ncbi:MAG TPA: NlpC/P60 family protein [Candidatus Eisenbacteria bacterium]|nr:NlpC/P60 family protein [Candidatus Eisenbacteria bacterium]
MRQPTKTGLQGKVHRKSAGLRLLAAAGLVSLSYATSIYAADTLTQENSAATSALRGRAKVELLGAKDGHEIVAVALEHEPASRKTQDCSHLVHEIYDRAGFPYPYASSFDLYVGSENFGRVKNPQAGDLIVWPGHVGIVANPKDHLFYSLVRSGLDTSDYQAPYWRGRGKARFYRYVVAGRRAVQTAGRAVEDSDGRPVVAEATRSRSVGPDAKISTREASERTAVYDPGDAESATADRAIPRSIAIAVGHKQPTREEVSAGISELNNASGAVLRSNTARSAVPLIVFDDFRVNRLEMKRDRGWAFVELRERASLWGEDAEFARRSETIRWELRRGTSGWEAVSPNDRTFVPRDVAIRNIAARISDLTQQNRGDRETSRREAARLTKLLGVLLEEDGNNSN